MNKWERAARLAALEDAQERLEDALTDAINDNENDDAGEAEDNAYFEALSALEEWNARHGDELAHLRAEAMHDD